MIKVCVEVGNDAPRKRVLVQAETIQGALNVVKERYPGCAARVVFPISPKAYFLGEPGARAGLIEPGAPGATAAGRDIGKSGGEAGTCVKAMVLAAGKGTRLLPLTGEIPKPMAPVAGEPIIGHIFELLARSGIEEIHVNVHYLAEVIVGLYGKETQVSGAKIHFSREEELMGTAGGVKRIAEHFDETFVVIMGDALTDVDVREVVAFHREHDAVATLALMRVADTSRYGVVELDSENNIVGFQEKPQASEAVSNLANTGIYILEPEVLEYIPENTFFDFAEDVFPRLLAAEEKFVGYEGDFYWSDVGTLEAYRRAQRDVLSGKVRVRIPGERRGSGLWIGRDAWLHPTASLRGQVVIGQEAIVGPAVTLVGDVTVGSGCWVSPGATVKRSILLPGSSVGAESYLEGCIVGPSYEVRSGDQIWGGALVRRAYINGLWIT